MALLFTASSFIISLKKIYSLNFYIKIYIFYILGQVSWKEVRSLWNFAFKEIADHVDAIIAALLLIFCRSRCKVVG